MHVLQTRRSLRTRYSTQREDYQQALKARDNPGLPGLHWGVARNGDGRSKKKVNRSHSCSMVRDVEIYPEGNVRQWEVFRQLGERMKFVLHSFPDDIVPKTAWCWHSILWYQRSRRQKWNLYNRMSETQEEEFQVHETWVKNSRKESIRPRQGLLMSKATEGNRAS